MTRAALILLVVSVVAAILSCGNDPRIIDAYVPHNGSDGSGPPAVCDGSNAEWMMACSSNASCNGCMCEAFGHNMYCTKLCTTNADCPPPATQCFMVLDGRKLCAQ